MNKPEYHSHEEFQNRVRKLSELRELGINPYPAKFHPTDHAAELEKKFEGEPIGDSEAAQRAETPEVTLAGRLVLFRAMGKNAFGQLQDDAGRIQIMLNRDHTSLSGFQPDQSSPDQPTALKTMGKKDRSRRYHRRARPSLPDP